ncbi:hypothetical protein J1605_014195 [Eschrichtius robustus]|uniref:Uncharacterized protein n=1 Tax=Eschrichtius robustus TaxID=9764 RepID=A0AB34GCT3_ESCRO|nr:hypothetical protein J1605_014195 [Eschrichtius robustus]
MWGDSHLGRETPESDKVSHPRPPSPLKLHLGTAVWTLLRDQSSAPCWKPVAGEQRRRIPGCTWTLQVMPGFQSQQNSAIAGGVDLPCFREVNRASCAGSQCGGGDAGTRTAAPQEANSRKGKRSPPDLRTAFQAFADPSTGHSSHCRRSGSSGCHFAIRTCHLASAQWVCLVRRSPCSSGLLQWAVWAAQGPCTPQPGTVLYPSRRCLVARRLKERGGFPGAQGDCHEARGRIRPSHDEVGCYRPPAARPRLSASVCTFYIFPLISLVRFSLKCQCPASGFKI